MVADPEARQALHMLFVDEAINNGAVFGGRWMGAQKAVMVLQFRLCSTQIEFARLPISLPLMMLRAYLLRRHPLATPRFPHNLRRRRWQILMDAWSCMCPAVA